MMLIEKSFILSITEGDAKALSDLLHLAYQTLKSEENYGGRDVYDTINAARDYRNTFADLIDRRYCGDDA